MKKLAAVCVVFALMLAISGAAWAGATTWEVATVHGLNEFSISPDGSSLHYNPQSWTDYVWTENNGSAPGTIAQGMYGDRTGMKTYAATDVAMGQKLSDVKLVFEYKHSLGAYPSINFFMTDGNGKFGIFSPGSGGIATFGQIQQLDSEWSRMTFDMTRTDVLNTANVAVYEQNGLAANKVEPYTTMQWGDIKDLTIAGMFDYQRSPENGWSYWGEMFDQINTAGNPTVVNGYGVNLIWGDTVNSNNSYGSAPREIRNVTVSFGGTDYAGTFENAQIPEPATMAILALGGLLLRRKK